MHKYLRCTHGNSDTDSNSLGNDATSNTNGYFYADVHTYSNSHSFTDRYSYLYSHPNSHVYSYTNSDGYSHADTNRYGDSNCNSARDRTGKAEKALEAPAGAEQ